MANANISPKRVRRQRWQALFCLVPLLAVNTELLPAFVALSAAAEGSHTTYFGVCGGRFRIVLSHERGDPSRPNYLPSHQPADPAHHHGLASDLVCLMRHSPRQADHVGSFSLGSLAEERGGLIREPASAGAPDWVPVFEAPATSLKAVMRLLSFEEHAPFTALELSLQAVRTTVLLL